MQVPVPDQEGDWQGAGKSAWGFVGCTGFSSKGRWPLRRVTRVLLRPQRALESPWEGKILGHEAWGRACDSAVKGALLKP